MENKDFEMINQKLIDGYIARMRNHVHMLDDDSYPNAKRYRIGYSEEWIGRKQYKSFHRQDILKYANTDMKMTKVRKFDLINFTLIDLKIERMIAEHCSMMNGAFRNVEFFRFCIDGKPMYHYEILKGNEYHDHRNIVMNCTFDNCVFMNSYAVHTDWINCKFINCTFINSEFCCSGSEYQNCTFENNMILNIRT